MAAELEFDVTENLRQAMDIVVPKDVPALQDAVSPEAMAQTAVQAIVAHPSVAVIRGPFATLLDGVKRFLGGFVGMFKSKKAFIAAVLLIINWIVLSILESKGIDPAPIKALSWATFGGSVADRTALGILGNIAGRSVVATMIISLFSGGPKQFGRGLKQMFSKKISETAAGLIPQELKDGAQSVRTASMQAQQTVNNAKQTAQQTVAKAKNEVNNAKQMAKSGNLTWFILGVGLSLMLYAFFTGTPSLAKTMAGISGAFVSVAALGKNNGWIRAMAQALTAKKTGATRLLNEAGTRRLMGGMTAGFAAAAALSALPLSDNAFLSHLHTIVGAVLVLVGLVLAFTAKVNFGTLFFIFLVATGIGLISFFGTGEAAAGDSSKPSGTSNANTGKKPKEPAGASYGKGDEADLYVAEDGSVAFYDLDKRFVCMIRPLNGFELDRGSSWPTHVNYILKADEAIEYTVWSIGDNTKDIFSGKFAEEHPDLVFESKSLGMVAGGTREIFKGHEKYTVDYRGVLEERENYYLYIPYLHTESKSGKEYQEALTVQFEDELLTTVSEWTDEQWLKAAQMIFGK